MAGLSILRRLRNTVTRPRERRRISLAPGAVDRVQLGDTVCLSIPGAGDRGRSRVFLTHERITYVEPVADWGQRDGIEFYPEAPGRYTLSLEFERGDGSTGRTETGVDVPGFAALGPRLIRATRRTRLWVPSQWEQQLASRYEDASLRALGTLVRRDAVAYDIGANVGLYAVQLARLTGPQGRVYAIEANPLCVYFLDVNLTLNGIENVRILPVAILDHRRPCEFTVNYHNSLVGVLAGTPLPKSGHKFVVTGIGLDELIREQALPIPDFIKMDIEGAETAAIRGMEQTLAARRPTLLFELHGQAAARDTLGPIASLGYRYLEPASGSEFRDARTLINWFPEACLQVVARAD